MIGMTRQAFRCCKWVAEAVTIQNGSRSPLASIGSSSAPTDEMDHETLVRQVMSGMERQIADFTSREESTSGIAKESKQKVGKRRPAKDWSGVRMITNSSPRKAVDPAPQPKAKQQ